MTDETQHEHQIHEAVRMAQIGAIGLQARAGVRTLLGLLDVGTPSHELARRAYDDITMLVQDATAGLHALGVPIQVVKIGTNVDHHGRPEVTQAGDNDHAV